MIFGWRLPKQEHTTEKMYFEINGNHKRQNFNLFYTKNWLNERLIN